MKTSGKGWSEHAQRPTKQVINLASQDTLTISPRISEIEKLPSHEETKERDLCS